MTTLLDRLRAETRLSHEKTEHLLYSDDLRAGTLSPDAYRHLLLTHAAYHEALEQAIDQHPDFFDAYKPDTRRKTPWLQADLAQLQLVIPSLHPSVFADWSPVQLLGAAYVGEGSMLGGKTVWLYLQQSPALEPLLHKARFYRGYGPETGVKWKEFGAFISQKGAGQADLVVEAAGRAFQVYQELFGQTQADSRRELPQA
ncbi:biliverdin-producing heme oxygenase [Spirosoma utsteinense]|uniref:Heme oxygenase n=1 Tax=Spirosoma utsteinense TaxID=2585773 RepID=A0ABR6WC65_9BACT|nr:biliverdin-producing heme oxygenase [Spirosoma utsteinense]MBC3788204.1 heme oxygenase [Spirosoma utsteinense]MBC3794165.1 heme oxygenase [Spirosoma utsteinense]